MFKTIVLAYLVANPTECWEYTDAWGPYKTREQCVSRAYQMGNAILEINKGKIKPQKFRCDVLKGTQL